MVSVPVAIAAPTHLRPRCPLELRSLGLACNDPSTVIGSGGPGFGVAAIRDHKQDVLDLLILKDIRRRRSIWQ